MNSKKIFSIFLWLSLLISSVFPLENLSISLNTGSCLDGVFQSDFLFIASERGVDIYSLSNPNDPEIVHYLNTPGICTDVFIENALLFTGDGSSGIEVYDISDPSNPSLLSTYSSTHSYSELFVSDSVCVVSTKPDGISLFTYGQSSILEHKSHIPLNYEVKGIFVKDSLLIAGLSNAGFIIFNIADLSAPEQLFLVSNISGLNNLTGEDTLIYLATGNTGISIFNTTNPLSPDSIGSYQFSDYIHNLSVYDTMLFCVGMRDTIYVLNVSNPVTPLLSHTIHTILPAQYPSTDGAILYVSETITGELFSVPTFSKYANIDTLYPVTDCFLSRSLAFVASTGKGLITFDIQNPHAPSFLSCFDSVNTIETVLVRDSIAYCACGSDGLKILNMSNPLQPTIIASFNTPGTLHSIRKKGTTLFLADGGSGFQAVSIENISNPVMLDSVQLPGHTYSIYLTDTLAFVSLGIKGFCVLSIKDHSNIVIIDTVGFIGFSKSIAASNTHIFVATNDNGIEIFKNTAGGHPQYVSNYPVNTPVHDIHYENDLLFLAVDHAGIIIVDVSNETVPVTYDVLETPGIAVNIHTYINMVALADYYSFRLDSFPYTDTIPPSPVLNLSFEAQDSLIMLRWTNPNDGDYRGTRLLFSNDTFPEHPDDGTQLLDHEMGPGSPDSFPHSDLPGDSTRFFYAVYAYDRAGNFSVPSLISGISASDTIPPGNVGSVDFDFWSDTLKIFFMTPNDPDLAGVRLLYNLTHIPQHIHDGTVLVDQSYTPNSYNEVTLGGVHFDTMYYFVFFSKDSVPNFSDGTIDSFRTTQDVTPPDTIMDFAATQVFPKTIRISWINPVDADLEYVKIRWTTNTYPALPESGNVLWNEQANPGDTISREWTWDYFSPGVRYYFSGFSVDRTGNVSPGAHALCLTPKLTQVSTSQPHEPVEGGVASWLDSVEVSFTAPVQFGTLQTGIEITGRHNYDFIVERQNANRYSFIPPSFSSLDTVRVVLHNTIIDSVGNPFDGNGNGLPDANDDYTWNFYTTLICDYTVDDTINAEDFSIFRNAYFSQDITGETGPCMGSIPYYTLLPDTILNFEDFSIFVMMWNWSLNNRGVPIISSNDTDSLLSFTRNGDAVSIHSVKKRNVIAGEIIIHELIDSVIVRREEGLTPNDVFLSKRKGNQLLITFGIMSPEMENTAIAAIEFQTPPEQIRYSYRFVYADGVTDGKGIYTCLPLIPKKILLQSIFPNPGNRISIKYGIPEEMNITIDLYNIAGRHIMNLYRGRKHAGFHTILLNRKETASAIPNGIYFVRLNTIDTSTVRKIVLLQ